MLNKLWRWWTSEVTTQVIPTTEDGLDGECLIRYVRNYKDGRKETIAQYVGHGIDWIALPPTFFSVVPRGQQAAYLQSIWMRERVEEKIESVQKEKNLRAEADCEGETWRIR